MLRKPLDLRAGGEEEQTLKRPRWRCPLPQASQHRDSQALGGGGGVKEEGEEGKKCGERGGGAGAGEWGMEEGEQEEQDGEGEQEEGEENRREEGKVREE